MLRKNCTLENLLIENTKGRDRQSPQPNFAELIYQNRDKSKIESFDYSIPMMGNNQTHQLDKLMAISLNKLKDHGILKKFYIREMRREDAMAIKSIENEEL